MSELDEKNFMMTTSKKILLRREGKVNEQKLLRSNPSYGGLDFGWGKREVIEALGFLASSLSKFLKMGSRD